MVLEFCRFYVFTVLYPMKFLVYLWGMTLFLYGQGVEVLSYAYHIDAAGTWEVKDAYAHKDDFTPLAGKNPSLGFKSETVWIYIKVKNSTTIPSANVIEFAYPQHDNLNVYKYHKGAMEEHYVTGDLHPFDTREVQSHVFVVPYTLQGNDMKEFLFKIKSNSSLNVGITFYTAKAYDTHAFNDKLFLAVYYSVVFLVIFYNFILYFIVKEKVYLHYATFHLFYFFLHFTMNGLSFQYLYPDYPWLNLYAVPIFFILANYLSIRFTITYLSLEYYEKRISHYLFLLMRLFLGLLVLSFFLPYALVAQAMTALAMLSVITLFGVGIYIWYKYKTISSTFFLLGWGILLVGASINVLQNLGFIPMNTLTNYSAQIGALAELIILSLSLAYNYNILLKKSEQSNYALEELTKTLEKQVLQRTTLLKETNQTLQQEVTNKNVLFKELYHRVKNNLQIISSLLSLQSMEVKDTHAKNILNEMTNRIKSISFIHEKLYQSNDLTHVEMQNYVESLGSELENSLQTKDISFIISCKNISLDLETSVPIGIIINELVTNAIKYAFDSHTTGNTIVIKFSTIDRHTYTLHISDNGKGTDIASMQEGFGFQIVQSIVNHQLLGQIESHNKNGLTHTITFKPKDNS